MGRLTSLKPRIGTLKTNIAYLPEGRQARDRHRDRQPWRKWYKTSEWRRLRWATLVRDLFTCGMCGRLENDTSKLVADHRTPHRGDERLFWDAGNLWCLCKPCHDGAKQREEARL